MLLGGAREYLQMPRPSLPSVLPQSLDTVLAENSSRSEAAAAEVVGEVQLLEADAVAVTRTKVTPSRSRAEATPIPRRASSVGPQLPFRPRTSKIGGDMSEKSLGPVKDPRKPLPPVRHVTGAGGARRAPHCAARSDVWTCGRTTSRGRRRS